VLGPVDCPQTTLDPGTSMTCAMAYVSTQEDVERGSITNAIIADGRTRRARRKPTTPRKPSSSRPP
jgi:hypothetical protein